MFKKLTRSKTSSWKLVVLIEKKYLFTLLPKCFHITCKFVKTDHAGDRKFSNQQSSNFFQKLKTTPLISDTPDSGVPEMIAIRFVGGYPVG